jgi:carbon monoxide dehydrogenase subunit G
VADVKFAGAFEVEASQSEVWEKIRNPGLMAQCSPGCDSIEKLSDTSYRAVVAVKVGPIGAKFNLVVDVLDEEPPTKVLARARGEEGGRASALTSDNVLRLTSLGEQRTRVEYEAEVNLTGRLGKFGLGVMKKKVEQLSVVFVASFRGRLESAAAA